MLRKVRASVLLFTLAFDQYLLLIKAQLIVKNLLQLRIAVTAKNCLYLLARGVIIFIDYLNIRVCIALKNRKKTSI